MVCHLIITGHVFEEEIGLKYACYYAKIGLMTGLCIR